MSEKDRPTPNLPAKRSATDSSTLDPVAQFLGKARHYPLLTADEERALAARYHTGDLEAAKKLVVHNLRLVAKIAYEYRRHWSTMQDLLQEGGIGLMMAVKKWDPEKGAKFGSYSTYWIRAYILRFLLKNSRLLHVGNTRAGRKLFFRLEKERQRLRGQGFEPTTKLLAERLDVKEQDLIDVGGHLDSREVSMDLKMGGDGPTVGERIAGVNASPEDVAARNELANSVTKVMERFVATLDDVREQAVWSEHLVAIDPQSLSELGERFGVSKQRMGQIANKLKERFKKTLLNELGDDADVGWSS